MTSYKKLSSGSSSNFNLNEIQQNLKLYQTKLKEYQNAPASRQQAIHSEIKSLKRSLKSEFSKPRITSEDKSRLELLEKNYIELKSKFSSIKTQRYQHDKHDASDDMFGGIVERESLVVTSEQIKEEEYLKRKNEIEKLYKDMKIVNEMFKDTPLMIKEQNDMLVKIEEHAGNAVMESSKGVNELHKADGYQKKASKKMLCIFIIAGVVVAVLLAIVLGVVVF